jgi:hypothetical protein
MPSSDEQEAASTVSNETTEMPESPPPKGRGTATQDDGSDDAAKSGAGDE